MMSTTPWRSRFAGVALGLRCARDAQSLAYLLVVPMLGCWMWHHGWQPLLYGSMLVLWIGVGVIHHHHAHVPMWHQRSLNRVTDAWIAMLQGHPTYAFVATHNANHHRFRHGPDDWARTYRFRGGDTNHLFGYALHPFQAGWVLYPHFLRHLLRLRGPRVGMRRWAMMQYALVLSVWLLVAWLDWRKAIVYVLLPQFIAMHCLLAANYLQHAHADGHSRWNYARNFVGVMNHLYFNIGFHTAHHEHPRAHWSSLPRLHAALRDRVHPSLNEPSLVRYLVRVMLLAPFSARHRSHSLMMHARASLDRVPASSCPPATPF